MFDGWIRDHASWTPRAPAVVTPGRVQTYAGFDADIDRIGAALIEAGIHRNCGVVAVAIDLPYLNYLATCALARLGVPSSAAGDAAADICIADHPPGYEHPRIIRAGREWMNDALARPHHRLAAVDLDPDALGRV